MKTLKIRKHNINIIKIHDQVIEKPLPGEPRDQKDQKTQTRENSI